MPSFDRIVIMPHAKKRLAERGATEAEATATICNPEKKTFQYAGTHGGKVYLHSKAIGATKLYVAAEVVAKTAFIITAYWDT